MNIKKIIGLALIATSLVSGLAVAETVEHHTVLTGTIATVVPVGTAVQAGDTLVTVETLAGPMAASKAIVNGRVIATSVAAGDTVKRGQVVVSIEENN